MELKNLSVLAKFPILRDQTGQSRSIEARRNQVSYDVVDFNRDGKSGDGAGYPQEPVLKTNLAVTLFAKGNPAVLDGKDVEFALVKNSLTSLCPSEETVDGDELARQLSTKAVKGAIFMEDGKAYFEVLGLPGESAPSELPGIRHWGSNPHILMASDSVSPFSDSVYHPRLDRESIPQRDNSCLVLGPQEVWTQRPKLDSSGELATMTSFPGLISKMLAEP